ncbi:HEAT repeat domain-containing protein [Frigoriglobus tundricola]|uniref:NADP-dependent oxidoreductase domain-containing protein n=1 Tax=Frigoriglobus tundricola TaxID=2774151 RepID=A0A6M5Z4N5_9BACT|nr:HEAT repeat domain-containing protein [Frigoriglobus tundricola]QJX00434.1 hypothetical protein FTUN_8064 [Frigoriglobus tundricola]
MRVPNNHTLARTCTLLDSEFAASTAEILRGTTEPAEVEALVERVLDPEAGATVALAALRALEHDASPLVIDTVVRALNSPHASVRIFAAGETVRRQLVPDASRYLSRLLTTDPFWQVRRAALDALAEGGRRTQLVPASNDPHWRVRYALARWLEMWGRDPAWRDNVLELLLVPEPHAVRLRDYLHYRWTGAVPSRVEPDPRGWCPFWDWDAAVLARNLEQLGRGGRRDALGVLVRLVNHPDERVRAWVVRALRDDGTPEQWADAIVLLSDPREDTAPVIEALTRGIELERTEEVAKCLLARQALPHAALRWAHRQMADARPAPDSEERFQPFAEEDGIPMPPYPANHPYARAAALTPERAKQLVDDPTLETSWFVLSRAAKMCRVPIWNLAPETPWQPPAQPREVPDSLALPSIILVRPRQLGPGGPVVSPLGVSGHYGLPVEGYVRAAEQGVNLFFWEPNYATLTRFVTRLAPADRRGIHILAGTFEADPVRIRKDVERALRNLKLERLSVFLIFWTQSWQRITPDVRDAIEKLKSDGLVQVFGLSTHNREIARDAILDGWNPVMVRHSAAHRKAETEVFPHAIERGTSILTFNNTCYGRLLDPSFRPSDCFRYTLNTPGVTACFTAPATLEYLEENLDALRNPELPEAAREKLLKRGEWMYCEDTVFRKTVRAEV